MSPALCIVITRALLNALGNIPVSIILFMILTRIGVIYGDKILYTNVGISQIPPLFLF